MSGGRFFCSIEVEGFKRVCGFRFGALGFRLCWPRCCNSRYAHFMPEQGGRVIFSIMLCKLSRKFVAARWGIGGGT